MNPHQKPQEDVVEKLRAALRPLALADIDVSGTAACGITREDIIRAVDAYEASAGATSAYEAGRRDMREAAGWQPIDTAPKDGTHVLLYGPAKWLGRGTHALDTGWYCEISGEGRWITDASKSPTHWQPLPIEPLGGEG